MSEINVKDTFKLGFGLMRLPHLKDGSNDMPQICGKASTLLSNVAKLFISKPLSPC